MRKLERIGSAQLVGRILYLCKSGHDHSDPRYVALCDGANVETDGNR